MNFIQVMNHKITFLGNLKGLNGVNADKAMTYQSLLTGCLNLKLLVDTYF